MHEALQLLADDLDDASADVIAQKLRQAGFDISTRSVERVIEAYGLQKKTLSLPPGH